MNEIALLTKLIALPTFVNDSNNESKGMEYLAQIVQDELPTINVELQPIGEGRYNLYVGNPQPKLLFIGHLDTVLPTSGWETGPLVLTKRDDQLYGLGTADMKGSIAAFFAALFALKSEIDLTALGVLIYADEEYDFLGMKAFIAQSKRINPTLVVSLDGDLEVASGCRGCIELLLQLETKTGHAKKAMFGNNVITATTKLFELLEKKLLSNFDPYLGPTTSNLAYLQGGIRIENNGNVFWQREGNIIPKDAEVTIEIRPSTNNVTADYVIQQINEYAKALDISIVDIKRRHDLAPLPVAYKNNEMAVIQTCYEKAVVPFNTKDRFFSGYIDMAMLTAITDSPMIIIGTGGACHIPNEAVEITDLSACKRICEKILLQYLNIS